MDEASLLEILNSLPTQRTKHTRISADVVPALVAWLGFEPSCIRFEYAFVFGASRVRVADAVVIDPDLGQPALLIEVKEGGDSAVHKQGRSQLQELLDLSGAFAGVLLTSRDLATIGGYVEHDISLGTLTSGSLNEWRRDFHQHYSVWKNGALQAKGRRPSPTTHPSAEYPECERLLRETRKAATNDEKKKSLESLVRFTIEQLPYLKVKYADIRTASSEIDLIVENKGRDQHTLFDEFGRHFLVECKNWAQRVGAKEVRDFVGKLLKTKVKLGVLATRLGVTGSSGGEDALREIQFCFDTLNTVVLVLSEKDLEALCKGVDLHTLLDEKLDRLRFNLP